MSLRDRLNRLERLNSKGTLAILKLLREAREAKGNYTPIPTGLDLATVYSMLIAEMPN
jgi:hypothetical protein